MSPEMTLDEFEKELIRRMSQMTLDELKEKCLHRFSEQYARASQFFKFAPTSWLSWLEELRQACEDCRAKSGEALKYEWQDYWILLTSI
jgi:hypothetical protein